MEQASVFFTQKFLVVSKLLFKKIYLLMVHDLILGLTLYSVHASQYSDQVCQAITRQPIELESCANHLWIRQVFYLRLKKNFVLGLWFSGRGVTSGRVLRFFADVAWPWAPTQ